MEKYHAQNESWEREQVYLNSVSEKALQLAGARPLSQSRWLVEAFGALAEGRRLLACTCAWLNLNLVKARASKAAPKAAAVRPLPHSRSHPPPRCD